MGKEYLKGLKDGLGGKIPIVAEAPYKVTDANIDAQIAKLKASGADVFMNSPRRNSPPWRSSEIAELGWKPLHFLASIVQFVLGRDSAGGPAKRGRHAVGGITGWRAKTRRRPATRRSANGAPSCSAMSRASASQRPGRPRLSGQQADCRGPEELRRRPVARKHHEAGPLAQGSAASHDGAGHPDQHQRVRPCDDRADADDALHQRPLAVLWPGAKRHRSGHRQRVLQDPLQVRHRHQARSGEPAQRQHGEPDDRLVRLDLCPGRRRSRLRARQRHHACGSCR